MIANSQHVSAPQLDWDCIDTVLLDMDGTLLDLCFDNYFWSELVPQSYAQARGITLAAARDDLLPRFTAQHGQLNWYCTDYWSRELALDIVELKRSARTRIAWLPGAERFLLALRRAEKRLLLVTNAHGDSLCIKDECTGIRRYFDAAISSHSYGHPKEHSAFWQRLQYEHYFDPARTLFIDDSLPVLRAAREFGIARVVAVTHPDSQLKQRECEEFPAVTRVVNLLPCASA